MTVLAITRDGKKLVVETVSGPASYPTGGFPITFSDGNRVHEVIAVANDGGYVAQPVKFATGNVINVKVLYQTGASGTPLVEVASGLDLSGVTFTAVALVT